MRNEKRSEQSAIGIAYFILLILSLSGCGGGGGSSPVVQGPPATPAGVNVVISASNELTISWGSVANATSYNVYWSGAPGASKNSTKISGITSTNYVHAGLISGNTYYYVVTALNSFGESNISTEVFALLTTPHPPAAVAAVAGNGQATLSWSANGAASYNIYMASQSGVTKANGTLFSGVTSPYTVTGLVNGTTYYFVVTSVNSFGESSESSELSVTAAAGSALTISGSVKYEDKEYGTSGFTGNTTYKAVRFAAVEAVNSASGLTVATGTTDASGLYSLTLPSASTIYIRAISSASSPISSATPMVGVRDLSNALYAVAGSNFTASGAAAMANISIPATSTAAGAFNILDVYTSGAQFVQSLSGYYPPALKAYWQTGNSNGTYFCSSTTPDPSCPYGVGIYVLNFSGDTDEYDDDVLWHEYGHFIAANYSKDDSPGGVHYLNTNDLDLRLSWSEGWGDFFPGAVKAWLDVTTPSLLSTKPLMATSVYVDTSGASANSFDFGSPPAGPDYVYSSNEAAVAKVLIDLRANSVYGMQAVWDVFTSSYIMNATTPVNFEVFWDGWNLLGKPDITAVLSARSILYSADSYEGDDTPNASRKAVLATPENHTLFGSGDVDYVAFDATATGQKFTVKTTSLRNGADTVIRIIAPDISTTVTSNDNTNGANYANTVPNNCDQWGECHENGLDILGSTTSFTAAAPGTYYVEVKSSPNRPLSAGKYGSYTLMITSQ